MKPYVHNAAGIDDLIANMQVCMATICVVIFEKPYLYDGDDTGMDNADAVVTADADADAAGVHAGAAGHVLPDGMTGDGGGYHTTAVSAPVSLPATAPLSTASMGNTMQPITGVVAFVVVLLVLVVVVAVVVWFRDNCLC